MPSRELWNLALALRRNPGDAALALRVAAILIAMAEEAAAIEHEPVPIGLRSLPARPSA